MIRKAVHWLIFGAMVLQLVSCMLGQSRMPGVPF